MASRLFSTSSHSSPSPLLSFSRVRSLASSWIRAKSVVCDVVFREWRLRVFLGRVSDLKISLRRFLKGLSLNNISRIFFNSFEKLNGNGPTGDTRPFREDTKLQNQLIYLIFSRINFVPRHYIFFFSFSSSFLIKSP